MDIIRQILINKFKSVRAHCTLFPESKPLCALDFLASIKSNFDHSVLHSKNAGDKYKFCLFASCKEMIVKIRNRGQDAYKPEPTGALDRSAIPPTPLRRNLELLLKKERTSRVRIPKTSIFFFLENDKFRQKMIADTKFLHL